MDEATQMSYADENFEFQIDVMDNHVIIPSDQLLNLQLLNRSIIGFHSIDESILSTKNTSKIAQPLKMSPKNTPSKTTTSKNVSSSIATSKNVTLQNSKDALLVSESSLAGMF